MSKEDALRAKSRRVKAQARFVYWGSARLWLVESCLIDMNRKVRPKCHNETDTGTELMSR